MITILDCYTDEPAGLGVPPYLGTYPRYIAGSMEEMPYYITIDDLRAFKRGISQKKQAKPSQKTDIETYNLTRNFPRIKEILENTSELIIIAGVHTPGKYLSAVPGTLNEIKKLTSGLKCRKVLTGPAVFGTSVEGGKFFERADLKDFELRNYDFSYDEIKKCAVKGADMLKQILDLRIIEIETGRGCSRKPGCSFCTEPIKHRIAFRKKEDVLAEIKALQNLGANDFRLGKQSDYYAHPEAIEIVNEIRERFNPRTLHIDNVNPMSVLSKKGEEITKAVVKYCTEGNVAAFGVESFDPEVIKQNNLNSMPEMIMKAIKILNKYGAEKGKNGMPKLLPGINLLFGLKGESRKTHEENMRWLKQISDEGLLLRRINIRQVNVFEGTELFDSVGNKFLKKNKKYYWKWRNEIRQKIDFPMLKKIVPEGTVLKNARAEIYDGKTTFARQLGTYPLIVGIKKRLELGKFYDVKVTNHMLRSIVGEII